MREIVANISNAINNRTENNSKRISDNYQNLICQFTAFMLDYASTLNLHSEDKKRIKSIKNKPYNKSLMETQELALLLIGGIKNYQKLDKWHVKKDINVHSNFEFFDYKKEIDDITNRLKNGLGFKDTKYLPSKTRKIFFPKGKRLIPNDDNLFFTFNIFHFHLTDMEKNDTLLFVQLTDNNANLLFIGTHADIYDYEKQLTVLKLLQNEFKNEVKIPTQYDELIKNITGNISSSNYVAKHVIAASMYLRTNMVAPCNISIIQPGIKLTHEHIKQARKMEWNIFTEDYYTTYSAHGIHMDTTKKAFGILKAFYLFAQSKDFTLNNIDLKQRFKSIIQSEIFD